MATKGIVDVTEQKRLNGAREKGIPWKKWGPYLMLARLTREQVGGEGART
jgi:hypothetical protein